MMGALASKGLKHKLMAVFGGRAGLRDALILLGLSAPGVVIAASLDVIEVVAHWSSDDVGWRVTEVFFLLVALSCGSWMFALRRAKELRAEASRRSRSESRFTDFVEVSSAWLWEMDDQLHLIMAGDGAPASVRKLAEERASWQLGGEMASDEAWSRHRADLARKRPFRDCRCRIVEEDGAVRHLQLNGKPIFDDEGDFVGYRGTGIDVTSEVEAEARATHLALNDALTDLPNRQRLLLRLHQTASLICRHGGAAALICLDLDRFNEINDAFGHATGDTLIKAFTRRIQALVQPDDIVARIGGDELAIIQFDAHQPEAAHELCRRLLASFAESFELDGHEVIMTGSIGVALIPQDGIESDDLLKHADLALHHAKAEGRSSFCFFEASMEAALQDRGTTEQDLLRALEQGEFELYYQPQIEAGTNAIVGLEALLRWQHPLRDLLEAKEFLPVAEATGLILPLGEWVLREACTQAGAWPKIRICVNLAPTQFQHPDIVDLVQEVLEHTGLDPARLELEIRENALLRDTQAALVVLDQLKALGVRIAMDDFGAGYSNLSYLQPFSFDKVKIDRSFVRALGLRDDAKDVAKAVVSLGRGLGAEVCAQGIETDAQRELLRREGCAELQGYHLAKPLSAQDINRLVEGGATPTIEAEGSMSAA